MSEEGGDAINLTRHPGNDFYPAWAPDCMQSDRFPERSARQLRDLFRATRRKRAAASDDGSRVE
jgi:hypothetical protein